jgi:hypothetical protein
MRFSKILTERVINGRGSVTKNMELEGVCRGTQFPAIRSKPSCLAPSKKLFLKYLKSDLTPSSMTPFLVLLLVRVKSDFKAPEPPYALAIASA